MPLYEYSCNNCGNDFEKTVSFAEADSKQKCPICGSGKTNKKISASAMIGGSSARGNSSISSSGGSCGSGGGFT